MKHLGVLGSVMLIFGVFLPAVHVPLMGSLNLFNNGQGTGWWFILLGVLGLCFSALRWHPYLLVPGALAGLLLYVKHQDFQKLWGREDNFDPIIQMQYGWAVLAGGAECLILGAFHRTPEAGAEKASGLQA
ncbi:hypothetical protein [Deinococcus cellulosilyticus]|uniref:Uncharacterized protein n=1 Tax=Deinococcus cellulosilyticus (strain DSM 18568 / NBRC 106333 / KACC 11606 / 5516J-15) TaxID=1223518 RepID=A0A511NA90_DEIC1|nr:hypothetical protein [Deinococcus cellulosilyticus]GEM49446.1 hypothetical protein DC3_50810 [Deinococcus cellulosilyticus NBRC 106333 = KACC 11606]